MFSRPSYPALVKCVCVVLLFGGCSLMRETRHDKPRILSTVTTYSSRDAAIREPFGIAVHDGEIYFSDGAAGTISKFLTDGGTTRTASGLNTPSGIAFLPDGDIVVADTGSHTIRKVSRDGSISILAGTENVAGSDDGPAHAAKFDGPTGVAVDQAGIVYVADTYNDRIRMIDESGVVTTVAGSSRGFADGDRTASKFDTPLGIAIWLDKLLIADSGNRRVRVVELNGNVTTLAGSGDAGLRDGTLAGSAFAGPSAIAIDGTAAIFIADGNAIRVIGRKVFPFVETLAGDRRGFADGPAARARFNRPSGIAIGAGGEILIADSDNGAVRVISAGEIGRAMTGGDVEEMQPTASEFRALQPARWPYDPPEGPRDIAGTLGEIRGEVSASRKPVWFHNGLDIAGAYGEETRLIRTETVLDPHAAQNFGTARELIRFPSIGYIHLRLGRDRSDTTFNDERFRFDRDEAGKLADVRVRRGSTFRAGEILGTLNSQNHVHLIAGPPGAEINALAALELPGVSDSIAPVIEKIQLLSETWSELDTVSNVPRIRVGDKLRVVVEAHDRMDGNAERRRLGVYRLGYQVLASGAPLADIDWTIVFDRMPANEAVRIAYATGSRSGATGRTSFRYIVTNRVDGESFSESFIDSRLLGPGKYVLRAHAADYFGNAAFKDLAFEIVPSESPQPR